jgi:thioredoxin 1
VKNSTLTEITLHKKWLFLVIIALLMVMVNCGNAGKKSGNNELAVRSANGQSNEQGSYKVTFIELGSVRCIPCKMMQPIMQEIEKEYGEQVKVVFYDVWTDEGRPYGNKYGITAIPTQVFLDSEGKEYYRHTGFFPKDQLVEILKQKGVR